MQSLPGIQQMLQMRQQATLAPIQQAGGVQGRVFQPSAPRQQSSGLGQGLADLGQGLGAIGGVVKEAKAKENATATVDAFFQPTLDQTQMQLAGDGAESRAQMSQMIHDSIPANKLGISPERQEWLKGWANKNPVKAQDIFAQMLLKSEDAGEAVKIGSTTPLYSADGQQYTGVWDGEKYVQKGGFKPDAGTKPTYKNMYDQKSKRARNVVVGSKDHTKLVSEGWLEGTRPATASKDQPFEWAWNKKEMKNEYLPVTEIRSRRGEFGQKKDITQIETGFRTRIKAVEDAYTDNARKFSIVKRAYDEGTGQGDIALLTAFQKMIDDGVVRSDDVNLQLRGASTWDNLKAQIANWSEGDVLGDEVRKNLQSMAGGVYEENLNAYLDRFKDSIGRIKNSGADPLNVIPPSAMNMIDNGVPDLWGKKEKQLNPSLPTPPAGFQVN